MGGITNININISTYLGTLARDSLELVFRSYVKLADEGCWVLPWLACVAPPRLSVLGLTSVSSTPLPPWDRAGHRRTDPRRSFQQGPSQNLEPSAASLAGRRTSGTRG